MSVQPTRTLPSGIPVYEVPGWGGATQGILLFGVGRADEPAARSGITHLVEHLALFPLGQQPYRFNGFVDSIRAAFFAFGSPEEVGGFLATVCRNITSLPLDRLDEERRVLRNESGNRVGGVSAHHAWLRYGVSGPGVEFLPEYGLYAASGVDVHRWAERGFTAGNAAVVWAGEPADLVLDLPSGDRRELVVPRSLIDVPVWAAGAPTFVAVSMEVERSSASAMAQRIFGKRLERRLRFDLALSYGVSLDYRALSATRALSVVSATTEQGDARRVRDAVVKALEEFEADGPGDEELDLDRDTMRRGQAEPTAAIAHADYVATEYLLGGAGISMADLQREADAVRADDVQTAFATAAASAILTSDASTEAPGGRFALLPNPIARVPVGRRLRSVAESSLSIKPKFVQLVVSDTEVGLIDGSGGGVAIAYADCAVAAVDNHGAVAVVDKSGADLTIDPAAWKGGAEAARTVVASIPPEVLVALGEDTSIAPPRREHVRPIRASSLGLWVGVTFLLLLFQAQGWSAIADKLRADPRFGDEATAVTASAVMMVTTALFLLAYLVAALRAYRSAPYIGVAATGCAALAALVWLIAGGPLSGAALPAIVVAGLLVQLYQRRGGIVASA